jgi:predicted esterase
MRSLLMALALSGLGCARPALPGTVGRSAPPAFAAAPPPAAAAPEPPPQPEEGASLDALDMPGFEPALVWMPRGAGPRPVLVAAHGAGDRPESYCEVWRAIAGGRGVVLCPRGRPLDSRAPAAERVYYYPDHHALGREVTAALAALKQRYGARVDMDAPIYAGFSQGATMGSLILPDNPARFVRAVLVEGGHGASGEWDLAAARRFQRGGGARVLLACGRLERAQQARRVEALLERAGVLARVLHVEGAGHTYGGAMTRGVEGAFSWLIEDDPRWASRAP